MSFKGNMRKLAKNLITKYGDDIAIVQVTVGAYDPSIGEAPTVETLTNSKASVYEYKSSEIIQGVINIDDIGMIIETDIPLDKSYLVDYRGSRWTIINIVKTTTQNAIIIYELQLRA